MLKSNIILLSNINKKKLNGNNIFQPIFIRWSYLYRGYAARTKINNNTCKLTLMANTSVGAKLDIKKMPFQPPRKNNVEIELIIKILPYSAKKNIANNIDEYSTL